MDPSATEAGRMNLVLETDNDRACERRVIDRLARRNTATTYIQLPSFSACDYLAVSRFGYATGLIEVKTRKETPEQIRKFGGLILKQRKAQELASIGKLLNLPAYVMFGFEDGNGALMQCDIGLLSDKQPVLTGRRDRNLATDEEPVILLNWPDWESPDLMDVTA